MGRSTTGSNVALFQRRSENQMRHTSLESTTSPIDGCEIGSRTQVISTRHPQRKLYEVHYARCVGIPNGRVPVCLAFGYFNPPDRWCAIGAGSKLCANFFNPLLQLTLKLLGALPVDATGRAPCPTFP